VRAPGNGRQGEKCTLRTDRNATNVREVYIPRVLRCLSAVIHATSAVHYRLSLYLTNDADNDLNQNQVNHTHNFNKSGFQFKSTALLRLSRSSSPSARPRDASSTGWLRDGYEGGRHVRTSSRPTLLVIDRDGKCHSYSRHSRSDWQEMNDINCSSFTVIRSSPKHGAEFGLSCVHTGSSAATCVVLRCVASCVVLRYVKCTQENGRWQAERHVCGWIDCCSCNGSLVHYVRQWWANVNWKITFI